MKHPKIGVLQNFITYNYFKKRVTATTEKRIAKNTLLLYIRMFISIIIGLYTSRVILEVLGVNDYGVYNVVGGIVAMFTFLNSAMTATSQRFISYELGTKNLNRLTEVFSTSVEIHVIIALIIFILAESIGLWFLNTKLNISPNRMVAANWVYQSTIISFMLTVISVPYNACIVAHERMKAYAYISILDILLKLLIVFVLLALPFDKLISYSILLTFVALTIRIIYSIYCKRNFKECSFQYIYNKKLFLEMFSFAGWSLIGNLGFAIKDQGSNIVLNLFYGTVLNAARGIAIQVNGIVSSFSNNFIMAINPQITKQYAAGNIDESIHLVYTGCRVSFFLLSIIAVPILINIDYLLFLWLGENIPPYTSDFLFYALWSSIISSMASPLVFALQATGKIKLFQIVICIIMLCEMPLAYLFLKFGYKPYYIMFATLFVTIIGLIARMVLLKHVIKKYSIRYFILNIFFKNLSLIVLSFYIALIIKRILPENFIYFLITSLIGVTITGIAIYLVGISSRERNFVNNKVKSLIIKPIIHRKIN